METTTAQKKFFSKQEAAKMLLISLPTIDRRIRDGTIAVVKFGRRVLIPVAFVEKLANFEGGEK